jgi:hypothetical protein
VVRILSVPYEKGQALTHDSDDDRHVSLAALAQWIGKTAKQRTIRQRKREEKINSPILFLDGSANHMLPSGPSVMPTS